MRDGELTLTDSDRKRLQCQAVFDGLPQGHYKIPFVERLAPRTREFGPGRICIGDLTKRDISALLEDEKAQETIDDGRYRIGGVAGYAGVNLGSYDKAAIHGGGKTLGLGLALSNFQPLTTPDHSIRIHNAQLEKIMDFLYLRLKCQQIVILSIV